MTLKKLKKLNASSSALTAQDLKALIEKSLKLEVLDIMHCKYLQGLSSLQFTNLTPKDMESLIDQLQKLKI